MNYKKLVEGAPIKSEEVMWGSVAAVSELVDELWKSHPDIARRWMMKEYARMYGDHFGKEMAEATVKEMWHMRNGERIDGEQVTVGEVRQMLPEEQREEWAWDAYVGANAFMHDLAGTGLQRRDVVALANAFWLHDDDFKCCNKVMWYFSNL